MKKVYFAHPTKTWEKDSKLKHMEKTIELGLRCRNYEVVNPFDKEEELNKKYGVVEYYDNPTLPHAKEIKEQDYELVGECEVFLGWFPKGYTCIGTCRELEYAIRHNKYVIIITYQPHPFLWDDDDVNEFYLSVEDFIKKKPFWRK